MPRIGLGFVGDYPINETITYAQLAERNGYDSVWIAEDLSLRDAVTPLAAFAVSTKKIKLASGILPIYHRTPALTAMTIATLDELSNGRMFLALGNGVRSWMENQGVNFKKTTTAMEEYIRIVRRLLLGELVTYKGEFYDLNEVKLTMKILRSSIPIYVATMGKKMFQLAGKVADGAFVGAGCYAPSYIEWARENMKIGAEKAGRRAQDTQLAAYVITSVSKDHNKAKESAKTSVAYLLAMDCFDPILEIMGLTMEEVTPTRKAWYSGNFKEAYARVTDGMLDASAIYGTPEECAKRMHVFRSAGVDLPVIMPVGDIKETIEFAKEW